MGSEQSPAYGGPAQRPYRPLELKEVDKGKEAKGTDEDKEAKGTDEAKGTEELPMIPTPL